jgi:flagellar basal-body rod protein FlgC
MNEFDILQSSAAGMEAQRSALDIAARNVAAASATQNGTSFARLVPRFAVADAGDATGDAFEPPDEPDDDAADGAEELPIRYVGAATERGAGVDAVTEMVSVLNAQRAYEANASIFDLGKRLAERTIDLGHLQ